MRTRQAYRTSCESQETVDLLLLEIQMRTRQEKEYRAPCESQETRSISCSSQNIHVSQELLERNGAREELFWKRRIGVGIGCGVSKNLEIDQRK